MVISKLNKLTFMLGRHCGLQFLKLYLFLAFLTCAGGYYSYASIQNQLSIRDREYESISVESGKETINHLLDEIRRDIRLISAHHELKRSLDDQSPPALQGFEQEMLQLSAATKLYERIRWIDESGRERMRVNFNAGKPRLTLTTELQDQSTSSYFLEANKLTAEHIYVSTLEFDVEPSNNDISRNPMLRIAAPVFDSLGNRRGIVVLDYFAAELLARFEKAVAKIAGHALLLNPQGFWLTLPLPDKGRGLIFTPTTPRFSTYRPSIWARINAADQGQFEDDEGIWTFNTVYLRQSDNALPEAMPANAWKIVSLLPAKTLYGNLGLCNTFLWSLLALLVLEAVGCWKLANLYQRGKQLQDQLRQSDNHLQNLMAVRIAQRLDDVVSREQAARKLQLLDTALKAAANAIIIVDSHAVILWANPAFAALTGFPLEDALGKPPKDLIRSGLQSEAFYLALSNSALNKRVWRGEIISKHRDGTFYTESLTISPIYLPESGITHFIAVKENISERKQAEKRLANLTRVYTMISNINQALLHTRERDALLNAACCIAVQDGGFSMAWMGVPGATGDTLIPAAFAGIDRETLGQFNNLPTSSEQNSYPANAAYAQMCNVGSNDIEHDPRTKAWRHKALALGYRSMLALPIKIKGSVVGVYSLYAGATDVFTNQEIKLLDDLANEIGFALEAADAEVGQCQANAEGGGCFNGSF